MLEWDDGDKYYDSKEEFLNAPFFNGKRLEEISSQISDMDYDLEP